MVREGANHEEISCVFPKRRCRMQIDYNQLNQGGQLDSVLSTLPYPLEKEKLVAQAQQAGANQQIIEAMRQVLPEETFNSPEEVKETIRSGGQTRH